MAAANQQDKQVLSAYCPVFQDAVELIGRRWTGAIVRTLLAGSTRFGEILARIPGLSDRLLSERLRELEAAGVVKRTVFPESPGPDRVRVDGEGPRASKRSSPRSAAGLTAGAPATANSTNRKLIPPVYRASRHAIQSRRQKGLRVYRFAGVLLVLILAGCGGGGASGDNPFGNNPTATNTPTQQVLGARSEQPATATSQPSPPAEYTVVDGDTLSESLRGSTRTPPPSSR
ncbi:MAG: helix-turn-helix domain-containing protein [Microthrixaceae bacterium]